VLPEKQKQQIRKIIQFGNIWIVFGIVYSLVEKGLMGSADHFQATGNPYNFKESLVINAIATLLMGVVQGVTEFYFLQRLFAKQTFLKKIFVKSLIYISAIILFILSLNSIYNSNVLDIKVFSMETLSMNLKFIESFSFWSVIIFVGCIVIICLLFSEISDYIGQNVLINFFTGRYHRPKTEERVFMFLDMKGSTSIAEKLGHVQYFKLLNNYYADMTDSILQTSGDIYQYAGDGLIITWNLKKGIYHNNCLVCFFKIKENLRKQSQKYIQDFGFLPDFKAALHSGRVTTGEIGLIKKEIVFTGDILNTTDRIQNLCNHYNVDILISQSLSEQLNMDGNYSVKEIGACELRGKGEKINLLTVWK